LSDIYNGEVLNGWLLDCLPRFWLLHFWKQSGNILIGVLRILQLYVLFKPMRIKTDVEH
jgi:hypothetical protein